MSFRCLSGSCSVSIRPLGHGSRTHDRTVFDVSKAYDRVNPAIILKKLINAEAPPWIIYFISQFCSKRTFQVRHREILSAKHAPLFSIPQGSSLSPLLFKLFFDAPDVDDESQDFLFVDDYAVIISDENLGNLQTRAQTILHKMREFEQNNGIRTKQWNSILCLQNSNHGYTL